MKGEKKAKHKKEKEELKEEPEVDIDDENKADDENMIKMDEECRMHEKEFPEPNDLVMVKDLLFSVKSLRSSMKEPMWIYLNSIIFKE